MSGGTLNKFLGLVPTIRNEERISMATDVAAGTGSLDRQGLEKWRADVEPRVVDDTGRAFDRAARSANVEEHGAVLSRIGIHAEVVGPEDAIARFFGEDKMAEATG